MIKPLLCVIVLTISHYLLAGNCESVASETDLKKHVLKKLSSKSGEVREIKFFASWCQECKSHLSTLSKSGNHTSTILVALWDKKKNAESVLSYFGLKSACYIDENQLIAKYFKVKKVPFSVNLPNKG